MMTRRRVVGLISDLCGLIFDLSQGECGLDGGKFPALRMAAENMQCVDDVGHVRLVFVVGL